MGNQVPDTMIVSTAHSYQGLLDSIADTHKCTRHVHHDGSDRSLEVHKSVSQLALWITTGRELRVVVTIRLGCDLYHIL